MQSKLEENPIKSARRLSDQILHAFHQACDQHDYEIAEQLLNVQEGLLSRLTVLRSGDRRKGVEGLVAAHERLWEIRHAAEAVL